MTRTFSCALKQMLTNSQELYTQYFRWRLLETDGGISRDQIIGGKE